MKTFFDAPHLNDFIEPIRITKTPRKSFPIRQDLSAIEYKISFVQKAEFFRPSPLGLIFPDDPRARMTDESDPSSTGHGLVEFTRTYMTTPSTRYEFESGSYTFPEYRDSENETIRESFTIQVVFRARYSYQYTEDPGQDLVLQDKFSSLDVNGSRVGYISPTTTPDSATYLSMTQSRTYIQAEQSLVERYKGNIWQIRDLEIISK